MNLEEAEASARSQAEHAFGWCLNAIREERNHLGLPADFEYVILVHGHEVPYEQGQQIIESFKAGEDIATLEVAIAALAATAHKPWQRLVLAKTEQELCAALLPLYARDENDTSIEDTHRNDASLLHLYNYRRGHRW